MLSSQISNTQTRTLPDQAALSSSAPSTESDYAECDQELCHYRARTVALLRSYARASVEIGRLPSLLGREFFRSRITSYSRSSFEDVVIFVTDMEHALEKLDGFERQLLAMNVLEDYSIPEMSRLLVCPKRTIERLLQAAIDELSRLLSQGG